MMHEGVSREEQALKDPLSNYHYVAQTQQRTKDRNRHCSRSIMQDKTASGEAKAIRTAVASPAHCTSSTVANLQRLLGAGKQERLEDTVPVPTKTASKTTTKGVPKATSRATTRGVTKTTRQTPKAVPATKANAKESAKDDVTVYADSNQVLSGKEKQRLATDVVNITLQVLTDGLKSAPKPSRRLSGVKPNSPSTTRNAAKTPLSRSASGALSQDASRPLSELPNNRLAPSRTNSSATTSTTRSSPPSPFASIAECSRIAFSHLRSQSPDTGPSLQTLTGMAALAGRLIAHGLDNLASKELRILKKHIESHGRKQKPVPSLEPALEKETIATLLFVDVKAQSKDLLAILVVHQTSVLKLIANSKRPTMIESAIAYIDPENPLSPSAIILKSLDQGEPKEKAVKQLESLTRTLLSFCPSPAVADDATAQDSKIFPSPDAVFKLQTFALVTRKQWWHLAGHIADLEKELHIPLSRFLDAYRRRSSNSSSSESYQSVHDLIGRLLPLKKPIQVPTSSRSTHYSIFRSLSLLAQRSAQSADAQMFVDAMRSACAELDHDSFLKTSASMRSMTLQLESEEKPFSRLGSSLSDAKSHLKGGKGSSEGLYNLISENTTLRRTAIKLLSRDYTVGALNARTEDMVFLCELLFFCAKSQLLILRQDDLSTSQSAVTSKTTSQFIASSLMACKLLLRSAGQPSESLPSALVVCNNLADTTEDAKENSTFVNISNVYWLYYQRLASLEDTQPQNGMQYLRRSVELLNDLPASEQETGFFAVKLERLAATLVSCNRFSEAAHVFSRAVDIRLTCGSLALLLKIAHNRPLHATIAGESELQPLLRNLRGFQQAALQQDKETCLYEDDSLDADAMAALLELQIPLFQQSLQSRSKRERVGQYLGNIFGRLLEIYSAEKNPLRRAFCCTSLLRMAKDHASIFDSTLVEQALDYQYSNDEMFEDQGLERFGPYTDAALKLTQIFYQDQPSLSDIMGVYKVFASIVQSSQTWADLMEKVDDSNAFIMQLKIIETFMAYKGQDKSCLKILQLLMQIHERQQPQETSMSMATASLLATTYLRMGYSERASSVVLKAENVAGLHAVPTMDRIRFQLVKTQISLAAGDLDVANTAASRADRLLRSLGSIPDSEKLMAQNLQADAAFVFSLANQHSGNLDAAFMHARNCVKLNQSMLAYLKRKTVPDAAAHSRPSPDIDSLTHDVEGLTMSNWDSVLQSPTKEADTVHGPAFWPVIPVFLRNMIHLHDLYAHAGRRFEAEYYANQARKLASYAESTAVKVQILSLDARHAYALGTAVPSSITTALTEAEKIENPFDVAKLYLVIGDSNAQNQLWSEADAAYNSVETLVTAMLSYNDDLSSPEQTPAKSNGVAKASTAVKKKAAVPKRALSRKRAAPVKSTVGGNDDLHAETDPSKESTPIVNLRATALTRKSMMMMCQGKRAKAVEYLDHARSIARGSDQKVMQSIADARLLMLKSAEEAAEDFTFNVLPESTLSFPALSSAARRKSHNDAPRSSLLSPPVHKVQLGSPKKNAVRKKQTPGGFTVSLFEARDRVLTLQSSAAHAQSMRVCYQICEIALQSTVLLSAIDADASMPKMHPTRAALSLELPRIESVRRDTDLVSIESRRAIDDKALFLPHRERNSNLTASQFQQDYIDIIPESWAAVSFSMSDDCSELYIVRYQARHSPFLIRLPMVRHKIQDLDDDDAEEFDFEAGREELREIIGLSDYSCHSVPSISTNAAKSTWWAEREALDRRLQELLVNIESIWLGGFKGILSQHHRDPSLLARFRRSFEGILDRHLPSRQGAKGSSKRLALDSNVLHLFIGLGDDQEGAVDIDQHLLDLLYFVIDVLQFNGERNAYDEVDFDSMATETLDALRAYHEAASSDSKVDDSHLILVLDKKLHGFPWESMPCLENVSVSRVGSMLTLRERILAMRKQQNDMDSDRFTTSKRSGTYIINPGSDLKTTEATLGPLLTSVETSTDCNWTSIANRVPTEAEFSQALTDTNMLLYFGHGSGSQYIRNRAIKRLDKCSDVVWLMGCSSGSVSENGDYEPTSVPLSYMVAGKSSSSSFCTATEPTDDDAVEDVESARDGLCMAVVATLWDVTDKDIDRFSVAVGEEWGLWSSIPQKASAHAAAQGLPKTPANRGRSAPKTPGMTPRKTPSRSRSRVARTEDERGGKRSLVQAVVKGRDACHLRFLNGAATVVYGIPVYLGD